MGKQTQRVGRIEMWGDRVVEKVGDRLGGGERWGRDSGKRTEMGDRLREKRDEGQTL